MNEEQNRPTPAQPAPSREEAPRQASPDRTYLSGFVVGGGLALLGILNYSKSHFVGIMMLVFAAIFFVVALLMKKHRG